MYSLEISGSEITVLNGAFFKTGIFSIKRTDGTQFGLPLLKYVVRILRTLPLDDDVRSKSNPVANPADWIVKQLRYLREVTRPAIASATRQHQRNTQKVGKNKLTIDIILNDCMFPTPPLDLDNTEQVYNYRNKCQSNPTTITLELPPWKDDLDNIMTESPPPTSVFTIEEIEKVIVNMPNNKASGSDGVTYENLKATRKTTCYILKSIFNTCLVNERQGMNEHVFCLKPAIDDFKHESAKLYIVFLDFRDVFGTLPRRVMIDALEETQLPKIYVDIIKDEYSDSYLYVICGKDLSRLEIGIKTGCPWSECCKLYHYNKSVAKMALYTCPASRPVTEPSPGLC